MTTPKTEALREALAKILERPWLADQYGSEASMPDDVAAKRAFDCVALLTSEREVSQRREAVLREALEKIAHQETTSEMESTNLNYEGDFEDAYDTIIGIARAALNSGDAG